MTAKQVLANTGVTVATSKAPAGSLGLGVGFADRGAQGTGNFKQPKTRPNGFKQVVVTTKVSSRSR
jgi:hypothetical protein